MVLNIPPVVAIHAVLASSAEMLEPIEPVAPVIVETVQFVPPSVVRRYCQLIVLIPQQTFSSTAENETEGFVEPIKPFAFCRTQEQVFVML